MRLRGVSEDGDQTVSTLREVVKSMTGVDVMQDENTFKSTYDIVLQLSKSYDTLSDKNRAFLNELIAGKQQGNVFASLMQNAKDLEAIYGTATQSAGSSAAEQAKYMESISARLNTLREEVVKFWNETINTDVVKGAIDGVTLLVQAFGNLPSILTLVTTAFLVFKGKALIDGIKTMIAYQTALGATSTSQAVLAGTTMGVSRAFNTLKLAIINNPLGLLAVALTTVIGALVLTENKTKKLSNTLKELNSEMSEVNQNQNLIKKYEDLQIQLKNTQKTSAEYATIQSQVLDVQKQLASNMPSLVDAYTKEGDALVTNLEALKKYNAEKRNSVLAEAGTTYNELSSRMTSSHASGNIGERLLFGGQALESSLIDQYNSINEKINGALAVDDKKSAEKYAKDIKDVESQITEFNKASIQLYSIGMKNVEYFDIASGKMMKYSDYLKQNTQAQEENANRTDSTGNKIKSLSEFQSDFAKQMQNSASEIKEINSVLDDYTKSGEFNYQTILKLSETYPQLLGLLDDEGALEKELIKIKGDKANAAVNSVKAQMNAEVNLINQLGAAYGVDVSNFVNGESSKTNALKQAIKDRMALRSAELQSYAQTTLGGDQSDAGMRNRLTEDRDASLAGKSLSQLASDLNAVDTSVANYYKLKSMASNVGKLLSGVGSDSHDGKGDASKKAEDAAEAREEAENAMKDNVKTVEDAITEIIKKEVERRKKLIESEYEARKDAVNKAKELYNESNEEDDFQKELKKEQESLNQINTSIVNAQRDTSLAGQARLEDLIKQQQEQQDKIDEMILERTREKNNDMFDQQLELLEKEQESKLTALDNQYSDENISKMVNQSMITGQIEGIGSVQDAYINFQNTYNQGLVTSGRIMEEEFLSKWREVQKLIAGTSGVNIGVSFGDLQRYANGGVNTTTGMAFLDGTVSNPELITNGKQAINLLRNLSLKPIQTPKINPISRNNGASVNFNEPFMIIQNVSSDVDMDSLVNKATDKVTRAIMQTYNDMGIYEH